MIYAMEQLREMPNLGNFVERVRQHLHQFPELRWQEDKTLSFLEDQIVQVCDGQKDTATIRHFRGGTAVDFNFNDGFLWDVWRADVDALPIQEGENDLHFRSSIKGVSHACGHDFNPAMTLGALWLLCRGEVMPTRNIRLILQRAEEGPGTKKDPITGKDVEPRSGGNVLVYDDGIFDDREYERVHILHPISTLPLGEFHSRQGPIMGSSDRMGVTFQATGGHVMSPHVGSNALRMYAAVLQFLDNFAAQFDPFKPLAIEPASAIFGKGQASSNVRPASGEAWWGVRHMLDREDQERLHYDLDMGIGRAVSSFLDGSVKVDMVKGHPTIINTDADMVTDLLQEQRAAVVEAKPELGGDDAAYYLQKCKGSYWFVGAGGPGYADHHSPGFCPENDVLYYGIRFWLTLASRLINC